MAQKAYLHMIKWGLKHGYTIDVFDSEEWFLDCSYKEAKDNIEAVDAVVNVYFRKDDVRRAVFFVMLDYNQPPEETIFDYSDNKIAQAWNADYEKDNPDI